MKGGRGGGKSGGRSNGMDMTSLGTGMKGIVSALSLSSEGILAAGTFSRNVGIFADEGLGDCITVFSLKNNNASSSTKAHEDENTVGTGITSLRWSPCGRYLYIAERQASSIQIYDIRVLGRRLGCLTGRRAKTNQRVGFDVVIGYDGAPEGMQTLEGQSEMNDNEIEAAGRMEGGGGHHNIWSGGTDGIVRVWANPHHISEETLAPTEGLGWKAHNGMLLVTNTAICHTPTRERKVTTNISKPATIASTTFHPTTNIVATCSGQRDFSLSTPSSTTIKKGKTPTAKLATASLLDEDESDNDNETSSSSDSASSDNADDDNEDNQGVLPSNSEDVRSAASQTHGDFSLKVWSFD